MLCNRKRVPFSATVFPFVSVIVALWLGGCHDSDPSVGEGGSGTGDTNDEDGGNGSTGTGGNTTGSGSSATACGEPPPGIYGDCVNEGNAACETVDATCLQNNYDDPDWGVCSRPCEDICDCWTPHPEGTAEPTCSTVFSGDKLCVLDCKEGKTCPLGMRCVIPNAAVSLCVFDVQG